MEAVFHVAVGADRVVVLEGETDGVDQDVAAAAHRIGFVLRETLARRRRRRRRGRRRVHVEWRRLEQFAQHVLAHQDAAVNGRRLIAMSVRRQERALRENSRAPGGVQRHLRSGHESRRLGQTVEREERPLRKREAPGE